MTSKADSPPSWPQPPIPAHLLLRRRRASALLTMPMIIALISIPAIILSFFVIPHAFSMSNKLWKSTVGIRRGWDSLNIVLVLLAVLCGIFAPRRGDEAVADEAGHAGANTRSSSPKAERAIKMTAEKWFQSIDRRIYELPEERTPVAGISRLRRNCGSYPDLMQESWPLMGEGRSRFFDDSTVEGHCRRLDQPTCVPLRRWESAIDQSEIKEIPVDTFVQHSLPPSSVASPEQVKPRPPPNPPPPPPPPIATQKKRPSYNYESFRERTRPSPPPPPPPPLPQRREQNPVRIERGKGSATAELKVIIASVLSANKRKKRKLKSRTVEESASVRHSTDETPDRRIPIPPPPPQPQSFLSIFKKTSKPRRIHSTSVQPPQPPPPPAKHGRRSTAPLSTKPPLPKIPKNNREDRSTRHPLGTPVAPPPPPSSFFPDRRRRSRGSGIAETDCDVSWSPPTAGKKSETSSSESDGAKGSVHVDGGDVVKGGPGPVFCESPDVNAKADTFIARLKDGWRLERMNSIGEKHGLGIGPNPL